MPNVNCTVAVTAHHVVYLIDERRQTKAFCEICLSDGVKNVTFLRADKPAFGSKI
jgi:hypothetical protein